jgi:hypothetical protein
MPEGINYNHRHIWKSYGISGSDDGYLTVGDIRDAIACYPDDAEVSFGICPHEEPLKFYRFHKRGEKVLGIEFG